MTTEAQVLGPVRPMPAARAASLPVQFWILFRMQLARVRLAWRPYIMVSTVMPVGIVVLVWLINRHATDVSAVGRQVVEGSVVLSLTISSESMLAQRVAFMRLTRAFDYYAAMPVSLGLLVAAVAGAFLLFALPGMLAVQILGSLMFGISRVPNLEVLLFIPPTAFALAGIGGWLGLAARDDQLAAVFGNLVMMLVLFMGSIPPENMPWALQAARWVLPSTYLVEALKGSLRGPLSMPHLFGYLAIVSGQALLLLWLVGKRIEWRR